MKAVYVDPPLVGRGIGSALLTAFDQWAAGAPAFLDVARYNTRAIEFYRCHGFCIVPESDCLAHGVIPTVDMVRP
ncbi:MAG: GNAT family N-acetyltransferase [Propionibacteriaceae bacterium]|nr:GNAT family N-acetyltransferase [Propionibacteriaceae bacterium]